MNTLKKLLVTKKTKKLNYGHQLAGNVKQEFILEKEAIKNTKWGNFLYQAVSWWIQNSMKKKIKKLDIISTWIVRQFENDYNPVHVHSGHISGVGYLKVPKNLGEYEQKNKNLIKMDPLA